MKYSKTIFVVVAAMLLSGCAARKAVVKTEPQKPVVTEGQTEVQKMVQAAPEFQSAQASKVKVVLEYAERKITANGAIDLIKDSLLIVSVQPLLGIELFRMEMTPTRILVVDKMNRRYVVAAFADLQKEMGFEVNFENIQSLCMSHLFLVGQTEKQMHTLEPMVSHEGEQTLLQYNTEKIGYTFVTEPTNHLLQAVRFTVPKSGAKAYVNYLNYESIDEVLFPRTVVIGYEGAKTKGTCTLNLLSLHFNGTPALQPTDLSRYTQVDLSTVLPKKQK